LCGKTLIDGQLHKSCMQQFNTINIRINEYIFKLMSDKLKS